MFSCSYTGGGRGEKKDQVEETLGRLLKEKPRGKILGKERVRAIKHPGGGAL